MKRALDLIIVITFLPFVLLTCLLIAMLVKINLGSPVLFRQTRIGLNGEKFDMFKFRTMSEEKDSKGDLLPDSNRLKKFGIFLRSKSLDELPELWNVFKGEMSLVGPRPLLPEYLPLYNTSQMRRHEVLPGITGWSQINGRNAISWNKKFDLDIWYIDHHSIWLDMKILFLTIGKILTGDGVNQTNHATTEKFNGH